MDPQLPSLEASEVWDYKSRPICPHLQSFTAYQENEVQNTSLSFSGGAKHQNIRASEFSGPGAVGH